MLNMLHNVIFITLKLCIYIYHATQRSDLKIKVEKIPSSKTGH